MNMRNGFAAAWRFLRGALGQRPMAGEAGALFTPDGGYGMAGSLWRGLNGRSLELAEVQQEVAAEMRGQVLVIGPHDEANRQLVARLRGQPPVPPGGPVYREGFFALATLPADQSGQPVAGHDAEHLALTEILSLVSEADALLYVFVDRPGWRAADARWYARLRATGTPLALVEMRLSPDEHRPPDPNPEAGDVAGARAALPAGERPIPISLTPSESATAPADVLALVERILEQRQRLAIPLAQEIPSCRMLIAGRTIRSGMLMAALLGAEPIPLLDLPLQVALNWRIALQLAAIYGHPGLDYRSREMIGTVAWNLGLRYVIQQALKLIPVLGWAASAALSGGGAWLFGQVLWRHYQQEGPESVGQNQKVEAGMRKIVQGWQGAQGRGQAVVAALRAATTHWRRAAVVRYAALAGRLTNRKLVFGKGRAGVDR